VTAASGSCQHSLVSNWRFEAATHLLSCRAYMSGKHHLGHKMSTGGRPSRLLAVAPDQRHVSSIRAGMAELC
jgi:hypothetical protein